MQISIYSLEGFVSLPNERFRVEALSACGPDFLDKCCKNNNLAPQKIWSKIFGLLLVGIKSFTLDAASLLTLM